MASFTTLNAQSVLWAISEQKLGFEFGTPERVSEDALSVVLPILRKSSTPRSYKTYPEVDFVKVHDSGSIDRMIAENQGQETCFIRSGTIFQGGTQERVSQRSTVVLAGAKADIKVRCVHQSKGIRLGTGVKYGTLSPLNFDRQVYQRSFTANDQSTYWSAARSVNRGLAAQGLLKSAAPVARTSSRSKGYSASNHPLMNYLHQEVGEPMMGAAAETVASDDLYGTMQDFGKNIDRILRKVKLHDDQVGLGLITDKGVETVEIFDVFNSWRAMHEDAVKRLGPDLAKNDTTGVFDYKPEKAREVIQKVLALEYQDNLIFEHKPKNGDPHFRILGLTSGQYTGEVVELDGKCIHLMLLRMEN